MWKMESERWYSANKKKRLYAEILFVNGNKNDKIRQNIWIFDIDSFLFKSILYALNSFFRDYINDGSEMVLCH